MKTTLPALMFSAVAIAMTTAHAAPTEFLNSGKVLPQNLPFSEAVRHGDTLYLSGQIGIAPGTLNLVAGGMKEEARQTMENIKTTLEAHGFGLDKYIEHPLVLQDGLALAPDRMGHGISFDWNGLAKLSG